MPLDFAAKLRHEGQILAYTTRDPSCPVQAGDGGVGLVGDIFLEL